LKKLEHKLSRRESIDIFKKGFYSSSMLEKPFDLDLRFDFELISEKPKKEEVSVNKLIKETKVDLKNFTIDRFLNLEQQLKDNLYHHKVMMAKLS
jgi:hypothetical protein